MLRDNSPLRRLPNFDRAELIRLDGIRHAAETIDFALRRLRHELTSFAYRQGKSEQDGEPFGSVSPDFYAAMFMDAWAIVLGIDRFHRLYISRLKANKDNIGKELAIPELEVITLLRNVDQHLSTLVENIVANQGTALGILRWATVLPTDSKYNSLLFTMLKPGTAIGSKWKMPTDLDKAAKATHPTFEIVLEAGKYKADLIAAVDVVAKKIRSIEEQLDSHTRDLNAESLGADEYMCLLLKPDIDDPSGQ